jgi:tetratricopeptide (TPR) repeat protein
MIRHVWALCLWSALAIAQSFPEAEWARLREAGSAAFASGSYESAERHFADALRLAEATGSKDIRLARSLAELGIMRTMARRCDEGIQLGMRSIRIYETLDAVSPAEAAQAWLNLARSYYCQGLFSNAEAAYRKGLDRAERAPAAAKGEIAEILASLAHVYQKRHNDGAAIEVAERALALVRDLPKVKPRTRALLLNNLGALYVRTGRKQEAAKTLAEALEAVQAIPNERDPARFYVVSNLGFTAFEDGRYGEAAARLYEALDLADRGAALTAVELETFLQGYSHCLAKLGRKADAKRILARATALKKRSAKPDPREWTTDWRELTAPGERKR